MHQKRCRATSSDQEAGRGEPMRRLFYGSVALLFLGFHANSTQTSSPAVPWAAYRFLLGEWIGEGKGGPGQGKGAFSFTTELQGKVLVRRNRADYPAAGGRP